jgi:hypothetical protein
MRKMLMMSTLQPKMIMNQHRKRNHGMKVIFNSADHFFKNLAKPKIVNIQILCPILGFLCVIRSFDLFINVFGHFFLILVSNCKVIIICNRFLIIICFDSLRNSGCFTINSTILTKS